VGQGRPELEAILHVPVKEPLLRLVEQDRITQNHRPFNDVLQLADVAGPLIRVEEIHRPPVYISKGFTGFLSIAINQVSGQQRNIASALS
jgi:hypothetical protein